jgi:Protein of unknown function (DUF3306)
MSEDFLTRWSRRKRDAVEPEQAKGAPGDRDVGPENPVPENETSFVEGSEGAKSSEPKSSEPVFDLESLPPIESITAATDIRPFLASGVPVDIARAALRRAWSSDPRIRDFVGLADYDWDYHTPGSAAGFGPLEMTDELRRMVARIFGEIGDTDTSKTAGEPATGAECEDESSAPRAEVKQLSPGDRERALAPSPDNAGTTVAGEPVATSAALQHDIPEDRGAQSQPRRGHGRALPR